jgi:translation elongation factor EF-G
MTSTTTATPTIVNKASLVSPSAPLLHRIIAARSLTRNLAIMAHVDHGKTSFSDSLLARATTAQLSTRASANASSTRCDEERERGITIAGQCRQRCSSTCQTPPF